MNMATTSNTSLHQQLNDNTFNVLVVKPPHLDTETLSRLYGGLIENIQHSSNNTLCHDVVSVSQRTSSPQPSLFDPESSPSRSTAAIERTDGNELENNLLEVMYKNYPNYVALQSLVKEFNSKWKKKVLNRGLYGLKGKNVLSKSDETSKPEWRLTENGKLLYEKTLNDRRPVKSSSTSRSSASFSVENTSKSTQVKLHSSSAGNGSTGKVFSLDVEGKKITLVLREYCGGDLNEAVRKQNQTQDGIIYLCDPRSTLDSKPNIIEDFMVTAWIDLKPYHPENKSLYTFDLIQPATVHEMDGSDEAIASFWTNFAKEMLKKKAIINVYEKHIEECVSLYKDQIQNTSNQPQNNLLSVTVYNHALALFEEKFKNDKANLEYFENLKKLKEQLLNELCIVNNASATARMQMKSNLEGKMKNAIKEYNKVMSQKRKNVSDVEFQRISDEAKGASEVTLQLTPREIESDVWQQLQAHFNQVISLEKQKFKEINKLNIKLLESNKMKLQDGHKIKHTTFIPPEQIHVVKGSAGFLGRGGYGEVHRAFTTAHGAVAVKYVKFTGSADDIQREIKKFIEEIEHCQLASHANVVRIEGYTQHEYHMAFIMEHMTGGTLSSLLYDTNIPISELVQLQICADIASGLTFLHHGFITDQRLTHGDIKPQNILLTAELRCKISDFGGSQLATCTGSRTTPRTSHRNLECTEGYADPERQGHSGRAMDVYSVSKVISNVLTRNARSQYFSLPEIDSEIADNSEIVRILKSEMCKCMSHAPKNRPEIKEVRDHLFMCLRTKSIAVIAQDVADTLSHMQLKQPYRYEHECVTFDQFHM